MKRLFVATGFHLFDRRSAPTQRAYRTEAGPPELLEERPPSTDLAVGSR
jgi:hypothetical protein